MILLRILFLFITMFLQIYSTTGPYVGCSWYTDQFGPLQSGYTMGDLVRYTVTPGLNCYSKMVVPPAGAQDIYMLGENTYFLYNFIGNLYAGSSLFSGNSSFTDAAKWVTSFRNPQGDSLELFDNNKNCRNTIEFPLTSLYTQIPTNSIKLPPTPEYDSLRSQSTISLSQTPIGANYYINSSYINNLANSGQEGNDWSLRGLANFSYQSGDSTNAFASFDGHYWDQGGYNLHGIVYGNFGPVIDNTPDAASASAAFCSNGSNGDMIMYFVEPDLQKYEQLPVIVLSDRQGHGISGARVYPTGQFFGARIAHVLGAVVNDVPDSSTSLNGSENFKSTLLSGSAGQIGSLPMIAVMSGGPYAISSSTTQPVGSASNDTVLPLPPVGMYQPSTAHFGSMYSFLSKLQRPPAVIVQQKLAYNYLQSHIQSAVKRLSTLCSYKISDNENSLNLIEMEDVNVTSYDNGVFVAIQNNTGDNLEVYQGLPTPLNQIGSLVDGNNAHYLHTASLMAGQTAPDQSQMISIIDNSQNIFGNVYIQILSVTQLQALYNAIDTKLASVTINGQSLSSLNYNQIMSGYVVPADTTPQYIVVTNFNPSIDSNNNLSLLNLPSDMNSQAAILNSFRIQALNISEFYEQPYLLTLQINKENVGYGVTTNYKMDESGNTAFNKDGNPEIEGYSISSGSKNSYILYPSITSVNIFSWQNYVHSLRNQGQQVLEHYSHIPLLMLPKNVLNSGIPGLNVYYIIWLMSYAAAMTECSSNGAIFGDILSVYDKVFNLFSSNTNKFTFQGNASSQLSRLVVDCQGVLLSGHVVELDHISLCGCDTWDSGGGFNQDIPMVNFILDGQDTYGNPIVSVNKNNAEFINLIANFGVAKSIVNPTDSSSTFQEAYGLPYSNSLIFSVPTKSLKDGINIEIVQLEANSYQLIVKTIKKYIDVDGNKIEAGSILAAPKVFIDPNLYDNTQLLTIDFLHKVKDAAWTSPFQISYINKAKESFTFDLAYSSSGSKNILKRYYPQLKKSKKGKASMPKSKKGIVYQAKAVVDSKVMVGKLAKTEVVADTTVHNSVVVKKNITE
ncbi:hypothetical protein HYV10_00980 [Candidatus Dependentiae bacterium]|nr:hypothetical protein [Candidatus Dependentiae bacterium]